MASNTYRSTPKAPTRIKPSAMQGPGYKQAFVYMNVEFTTAEAANAFATEVTRLIEANIGMTVPVNVKIGMPHGRSKYDREQCRCDVCSAEASGYQRDWLARQ